MQRHKLIQRSVLVVEARSFRMALNRDTALRNAGAEQIWQPETGNNRLPQVRILLRES